jgi:hypothetical protein
VIETKDLELVVERQIPRELLTNAEKIRDFVLERVKDYSPDNYVGKVKEAKDDRALLNKSAKDLNDKRIELERRFMAPFQEFKDVIGETVTAIKDASNKVGAVITEVEQRERDERKAEIEAAYNESGFDLVSFARVMDPKWLNKSTSGKAWRDELTAKIEKIRSDLSSLDAVEYADDAKAFYLDTLDIGRALQHAQSLKERREALQAEEAHKSQAEAEKAEDTPAEAPEPAQTEEQPETPQSKPQTDETFKFVIEVSGTREQLAALRAFIDEQGITYRKLGALN